jgi:hypothetical protein
MTRFAEFEAALLGMLIDKCNADAGDVARLLEPPDLDGRGLVRRVVALGLVDEYRLARLVSQYWERPLVDIAFPYRRFLVHFSRPVDDLLAEDLLPLEFDDGSFTVVGYYVPAEEVVRRLEARRGARMRLYVSNLGSVDEALLRLRAEVRRFREAEPVDCGTDKELFYKVTAEGWPAVVRENVAGSTIRVDFDKERRLTKTVECVDDTEPEAVAALLSGKSMSARIEPGDNIRALVHDFVETVGLFDGDLSEAILKLRVAQMMFEQDDNR